MLKYSGSNFLRQRLVLSTLSGRPVKVTDIRINDENPGVTDYEMDLLKLFNRITDGSTFSVDETGTTLYYKPGQLVGGADLVHNCCKSRCITYYLEPLLMLAPFCKDITTITLKGVTNSNTDVSIDTFRTTTLPLMRHFGVVDNLSLKVNSRGCMPDGGGEVVFRCPIVKKVEPFQVLEVGRVKRVRGVAYTTRLSTQFSTKMIDKAREVLNNLLPDVWVYADNMKGKDKTGNSPGFGICLVAETMQGHFKAADFCMDDSVSRLYQSAMGGGKGIEGGLNQDLANAAEASGVKTTSDDMMMAGGFGEVDGAGDLSEAELVGRLCAIKLLEELEQYGGVVDSSHQHIPLLFMAIAEEHAASKVKLGKLTPYAMQMLRHIKDFFGVQFDIQDKGDEVVVAGVGIGFQNMSRHGF